MLKTLLCTILFGLGPLHAQIYADFQVSHGENPLGTFRVLLEHEKAPRTCANFIGLATGKRPWIDLTNGSTRTNTPFYNGLTFHRLIHSFVIQGGSRNGQGTDGPGFLILDEYHPQLRHNSDYVLSMAKGAFPNTGGSQFFITLRAASELDDKHSVFGKVIEGRALIDGFKNPALFPTQAGDRPQTPIILNSVTITGPDAGAFDIVSPALRLPHATSTPVTPLRNEAEKTFALRFDRAAKTNYFYMVSQDLQDWFNPQNILSLANRAGFTFTYQGADSPKFFANLATVSYEHVPLAPSSVEFLKNGRTMRIYQSPEAWVDLVFNGTTNSGTWTSSEGGAGTLAIIRYHNYLPSSGLLVTENLEADNLPLAQLVLDFLPAASAPFGWTRLATYLSFHGDNSGWLEEIPGTPVRRRRFEILPSAP